MKKYVVEGIWYRKASGSCRSYVGKKATLYTSLPKETLEEAQKLKEELEKGYNPYKHYENLTIKEVDGGCQ